MALFIVISAVIGTVVLYGGLYAAIRKEYKEYKD